MVSSLEVIIRNGLPPDLVDDPIFRKTLVTTSFRKIIPTTDKRLDEENIGCQGGYLVSDEGFC